MYDDLLRIKQHREQAAGNALVRQQHQVEARARAVQTAREDAAKFHDFRHTQETRLFNDIKLRPVILRELEDMRRRVALLREKEADMEARILDAEKQLKQAKQELEQARQHHTEAVREREKFTQFMEAQWAVERRAKDAREEQELEEAVEGRHYSAERVD